MRSLVLGVTLLAIFALSINAAVPVSEISLATDARAETTAHAETTPAFDLITGELFWTVGFSEQCSGCTSQAFWDCIASCGLGLEECCNQCVFSCGPVTTEDEDC